MTDYELNNIDPENIEDLLVKVEKSFNIKFVGNELIALLTFGELCDHIVNKIKLDHSDNCTTQQAFYKLRNAISLILKRQQHTNRHTSYGHLAETKQSFISSANGE